MKINKIQRLFKKKTVSSNFIHKKRLKLYIFKKKKHEL
jgi:hypothetical protein